MPTQEINLKAGHIRSYHGLWSHMRDAIQRQHRVGPAGSQEGRGQAQCMSDQHVVVREAVDYQQRPSER